MRGVLAEICDLVVIIIDDDARECGINPCPTGTHALIEGFGEKFVGRTNNHGWKPGVYRQKDTLHLYLETGESIVLSSMYAELLDSEEYARREENWDDECLPVNLKESLFLRDLPDTPFWEMDRVYSNTFGEHGTIKRILYNNVGRTPEPGKILSGVYTITLDSGSETYANAEDLSLVEHGKVWNYYHDLPIIFRNIMDEAAFFESLGHYEAPPNHVTGNFVWSQQALMEGLTLGVIDLVLPGPNLRGITRRSSGIRFTDRNLGQRVRDSSMEMYGLLDPYY